MLASLEYVHIYDKKDSLVRLDMISRGITFIQKGNIAVSYKVLDNPILFLNTGSYLGDISYIFQKINKYKYLATSNVDDT